MPGVGVTLISEKKQKCFRFLKEEANAEKIGRLGGVDSLCLEECS